MNTNEMYIREFQKTIEKLDLTNIEQMVDWLQEARLNGNQVFVMGNGGSASTASHLVCDLAKGTRRPGWPSFRVIGLTDNMAILSAYANDEGYENVFANQLANLIQPRDIVIAISGSGNSWNVIRGIELARKCQARTIGLTGFDGGMLGKIVDLNVHVRCNRIEIVEDIHLMVEHMVATALRQVAETGSYQIELDSHPREDAPSLAFELLVNFSRMDMPSNSRADTRILLASLTSELAQISNLHDFLVRSIQIALNYVPATSGTIVIRDEHGQILDGVIALGGKVIEHPIQKLQEIGNVGLAGWVMQHNEAVNVPSTRDDPRWMQREWEYRTMDSHSALCVPLTARNRMVGAITLVHPETGHFNSDDLSLLSNVANMIATSFVESRMVPAVR